MSKRRKKIEYDSKTIAPELTAHFRRLGLKNVEQYVQWCKTHHRPHGLNKSDAQLEREYTFFATQKAAEVLKNSKKTQNLKHFIREVHQKKISSKQISGRTQTLLYQAFKNSTQPRVLLNTLLHLDALSNILKDYDLMEGVVQLVRIYDSWVRPVEEWKPATRNRERQFSSLLRHLLAQYHVPEFMDQAFTKRNPLHQKWFIHMGSGKNIRTSENLPVVLTKRMAHHFLSAPRDYSINEALRWAQVRGLGGDGFLMNALRETRLTTDFRDNDFWVTVFQFFIRHPMLDRVHINPIIDYIWNRKYENRTVFVARGVAEDIPPLQPNFCMNGRTPQTLLRQVEGWHRQLGRESMYGNFQWVHSLIKDFNWVEGSAYEKNMKTWSIRELLSSKELLAEGRAMKHGVGSYAHSCKNGGNSIWTMSMQHYDGGVKRVKLLTIQVREGQQICQVRGKRNRLATEKEINVIRRWANKENLEMAAYI